MQSSSKWFSDIIGLIIILGVFYALWLGSYPLFTPDEGRYSEVAREMVVSGDYITPRLDGVAFLDKPALYYWLQASAIRWFGLKEWALRIWPVIAGLLSVLVTYCTSRLLYNRSTGLLAAGILATSPLYYGAAHYANLDLEVASFIGNALLCYLTAVVGNVPRLRTGLLYAAYFFAGLAALTKGLIGIVFPIMIIGCWILLTNQWQLLWRMRIVSGLLLFLAMTLPWYVMVQHANPEFLHFFFYTQHISRFLTQQAFNSKVAIWFYFPVVIAGFFPWSLFLLQTLNHNIKAVWLDSQQRAKALFLLLWVVLVFIFFSIPQSKTVGYILPIFPALAVLVSHYLIMARSNFPNAFGIRLGRLLFVLAALSLGAFTAYVSLYPYAIAISRPLIPYLQWMAITVLVAAFGLLFTPKKYKFDGMLLAIFGAIVVGLLIFINSAKAINEKTVKPLVAGFSERIRPDDEVIAYYKYYQDLPLYLQRRITIVADWQANDIADNDNWVRELWYGMVFQDTSQWLINDSTFWRRVKGNTRIFVVTDNDYANTLQKHGNFFILNRYNDMVLLSNRA